MKIVFIMTSRLNTGRGTENVLLSLLRYKPEDVEAIIVEPNNLDEYRIDDDEVNSMIGNTKRLQMGFSINRYRNIVFFLFDGLITRSLFKARKNRDFAKIKELMVDAHLIYLFSNSLAVLFQDMYKPLIGSNHTDNLDILFRTRNYFRNFYNLYYFNLYYKNINGIHFFPRLSSKIKEIRFPNQLKYNFVLSNGIDTNLYYPKFDSENHKIKVLFVAALEKNKGVDIYIRLAKNLSKKLNIEFHIAGKGSYSEKVERESSIFYHKNLDNYALSCLYRSCDIFLYPTRNDTFALVVLQALSSGLFVMASDNLKGVFDDFEGRYLHYLKPNYKTFETQLKRNIELQLIKNYSKRELFEKIKKDFDWSIISVNFFDKLRQIINDYNDTSW